MKALTGAMPRSRELGFCIATLEPRGAALVGSPPGCHSHGSCLARTTGCQVCFAKIALVLLLKYHCCGILNTADRSGDGLGERSKCCPDDLNRDKKDSMQIVRCLQQKGAEMVSPGLLPQLHRPDTFAS